MTDKVKKTPRKAEKIVKDKESKNTKTKVTEPLVVNVTLVEPDKSEFTTQELNESIKIEDMKEEDFQSIMTAEIPNDLTLEQIELKRIAKARRAGRTKDAAASITRHRRKGRR